MCCCQSSEECRIPFHRLTLLDEWGGAQRTSGKRKRGPDTMNELTPATVVQHDAFARLLRQAKSVRWAVPSRLVAFDALANEELSLSAPSLVALELVQPAGATPAAVIRTLAALGVRSLDRLEVDASAVPSSLGPVLAAHATALQTLIAPGATGVSSLARLNPQHLRTLVLDDARLHLVDLMRLMVSSPHLELIRVRSLAQAPGWARVRRGEGDAIPHALHTLRLEECELHDRQVSTLLALAGTENLRVLGVSGSRRLDGSFLLDHDFPQLRTLAIDHTSLQPDVLQTLPTHSRLLTGIDVSFTRISLADYNALNTQLPSARLVVDGCRGLPRELRRRYT